MGVLRLTVWSLAVSGSAILNFACPELCHTLKSRCEPICALALGYAAEAPLNRLRKAFADAVKFCDSLLGSAKIVPIGWGYLPHCLKKILLKIMGA